MTLAIQGNALPASTNETLAKVYEAEDYILTLPQIEIHTEHILHGGMYARTIRLAAGVVITGALFKVSTILVVNGLCAMFAGDHWAQLDGFQVMAASKGRKQVFVTKEPTEITMIFRTDAKTVEDAENEFTDEADRLMSRTQDGDDVIIVTGE
jgi:glyoxylate carboligase